MPERLLCMMADTNATTTATTNGTSGSEPVPQWKKELLQRRKNLAKTIGAASVPVHDSASAVAAALTTPTTPKAAGPLFGGPLSPTNSSSSGQKDPFGEPTCSSPTDATSPVEFVDNPSNRDSPASPTAFGTPVFVGHSPSPPGSEPAAAAQQQVLVKSGVGRSPTNTATRELSTTTSAGEKQPLCTQSHSNDGTESTGSSTNSSSSRVAAAESSPGKYAAAAGISGSVVVECELARPAAAASASGETNSYSSSGSESWKLKKNTASSASSSTVSPNGKMVAASAEEIIYEKNVRTGVPGEVDPSEELKYGPGIVSKLRCRYLSLALRQSANKQRPSLNSMRRATSLNNLLDEESEDLSERETSIEAKDHAHSDKGGRDHYGKLGAREQLQNQLNLQQQLPPYQQKAKTPDEYISTFQKSVQNSYTRSGRQTEKKNEYNRYNKQRGADSLKRARSVEALVRYDHKAWERDIQKENLYSSNDSNVIILDEICASNGTTTTPTIINNNSNANNIANNCQTVAMNKAAADLIVDCVTIEEKIINGREKGDPKPKRLTSFIDADERPPPDVVRQTMKIFEANANRRGRPVARTNGAAGEVAAKVASYKSIISQEKPPITHPKPPLSPKKPNIIPRSTSPKSNGTANTANSKPPTLPKLDLTVIRTTSLETTNNLKNSANTTPSSTPTPTQNNAATSTPLSVRVEPPSTYRLKYESPALSPNNTSKVTTTTTATTNRAESPRILATALPASMQNNTNSTAHTFVDSPSIAALTSKLNCLNIATSTPTSTRSPTPSDTAAVAVAASPPQAPPRGVALQYATSDEEDPDDPEDQQREYSINSDRGSDSQPDDLELEDSEEDSDELDTSKTVSRAAMDNIAKAGVTTQFRFNGGGQNKSHLPGAGGAKLLATKLLNVDDHHSSNSSSTSSSPITVPATTTTTPPAVVTAKPPVPLSRESLSAANGLKSSSSVTANNHSNSLNNHNSSNANTSVNSNGSKLVINDTASAPPASSDAVKSLTAREIEKNQINLEKSVEESSPAAAVAVVAAPVVVHSASEKVKNNNGGSDGSGSTAGGDFFMAKWGPTASAAALVPVLVKKKVKAPPPPLEANTMVFNFSDRKDVPDYIENDGIILRPRPRELPKPGESGFVVLGDLTLETSTDPDDSWAMGPPSPCDVEFANANIVINGKSSMRNKTSRDSKCKIQFDDSLTSTFEYPSETSLLETNGFEPAADRTTVDGGVDAAANNGQPPSTGGGGGGGGGAGVAPFADNGLLSHKNTLLSSMPLGSAPFASYTPVKAAIDTTFELGVTRTPSPSASSNSSTLSNEAPPLPPTSHHHHSNGGTNGMITPQQQQQRFNGINGQDSGEPESIQYLKPASDDQTVNWSQGTRVTDLLF